MKILNTQRGHAPATGAAADDSGLVPKKVVAQRHSVSCRTIDNWVREKRIPIVRLSPRLVRFNLARVKAALERYEIREVK
jgi:excisionase family DNA binding protein